MRITYLPPGVDPDLDTQLWMLVERNSSGLFFGIGTGKNLSGEVVFYASAVANDDSLDAAVKTACEWADQHGIQEVQVQQYC